MTTCGNVPRTRNLRLNCRRRIGVVREESTASEYALGKRREVGEQIVGNTFLSEKEREIESHRDDGTRVAAELVFRMSNLLMQ